MTPEETIAALDADLDECADDPTAVLQRIGGPSGAVLFSTTVRAFVRAYDPKELSPAIIQGDSKIVLSPTDLVGVNWPTGEAAVPRRGDQLVVQGKPRQVIAPAPIHLVGIIVRLNVQVRG